MEKIKEYITNNKKIATIVAIVIALLVCCGIYFAVSSNNKDTDTEPKQTEEKKQTESETDKEIKLTDYVKGLKDWTVEVNSENIDFMDGVTFDKKIVKEVTVDDSKVDLKKEGKYDIIYSIEPVDDSISEETVKKIVTVEVVSIEKAQEETDKGNQVVVSNNEVKKDSEGNTPAPKEDSGSSNNAGNNGSSSNSGSSDNGNNSNAGNSGNNSNAGNSNADNNKPADKPSEPAHSHSWEYVAAVTHTEYKTETYTEQVPHYDYIGWYECKGCGAKFDNDTECADHCLFECKTNYTFKKEKVQNGYDTVTKERQVPYEVTDHEAYYKCSCGATK